MTATSPQFRYWVDMALECVRRDHTQKISAGDQRGPVLSARALGLALGALHDMAAAGPGGTPILPVAPAPPPGPAVVAAAAACHEVLVRRYPKQRGLLDSAWRDWVEYQKLTGIGPAETAGRAHGVAVDVFGANDPNWALPDQYKPTDAPYTHQLPDHEQGQGFAGGIWGKANPLVVPVVPGFPQPPRGDAHYDADLTLVKAKGHWNRAYGGPNGRDLNEELIGIYWGYDGPAALGTPPRLYLQVVLEALDNLEARSNGALGASEELRLVAGVAVAMADAGISAWHYKYNPAHLMWRPVVGIRKAGGAAADPAWLPLGRPDTNGTGQYLTPNFPAYPSGHATFGAAAFQVTRLFLAEKKLANFDAQGVDDIAFDFVSDEFDGRNTDPRTNVPRVHVTRGYDSLWRAIVDNSISRVFLGVHWQFDGITTKDGAGSKFGVPATPADTGQMGGVWLGAKIANALAVQKLGVTPPTVTASRLAV
ncbi:vanadium-dependent haloperoxidase [Phenylobacterium sp.]|uniref:vanadium-dependent haloperoxidase n=1 Tax=Phenylobacterium sp. TaxID=1871053 RepID=UPI003D2DA0BC